MTTTRKDDLKITRLTTPLSKSDVGHLRAGGLVILDGKIFTFRDKAYQRVISGKKPPADLKGSVIYHCGPIVKKTQNGWKIISAGPTTSARMDPMQVDFVRRTGARALVGKGGIGKEVAGRLAGLGCIYFAYTGGAGALAASQVQEVENVFWEELGPEAIWVLRVRDFGPLVVSTDTVGGNLYER